MTKLTLTCIAVLLFTAAPAPARAEFEITDKMIGLVIQCGPAIITITPDKKMQVTGLPYGDHPIDFKGGEMYVNGHLCKPLCKAPAQQQC
jgi:hypothetical protein